MSSEEEGRDHSVCKEDGSDNGSPESVDAEHLFNLHYKQAPWKEQRKRQRRRTAQKSKNQDVNAARDDEVEMPKVDQVEMDGEGSKADSENAKTEDQKLETGNSQGDQGDEKLEEEVESHACPPVPSFDAAPPACHAAGMAFLELHPKRKAKPPAGGASAGSGLQPKSMPRRPEEVVPDRQLWEMREQMKALAENLGLSRRGLEQLCGMEKRKRGKTANRPCHPY